jgi:murein DD-endopeptidase MepM/ murein hydrolase activator NlpD
VRSDTANKLQDMFGKKKQKLKNVSVDTGTTSYTINESLEFAIPAGSIANLSQGEFVGVVSDNFGQEIKTKIFRGKIKIDKRTDQVKGEIPNVFEESQVDDNLINNNFKRVIEEIDVLIDNELFKISQRDENNTIDNEVANKEHDVAEKEDENVGEDENAAEDENVAEDEGEDESENAAEDENVAENEDEGEDESENAAEDENVAEDEGENAAEDENVAENEDEDDAVTGGGRKNSKAKGAKNSSAQIKVKVITIFLAISWQWATCQPKMYAPPLIHSSKKMVQKASNINTIPFFSPISFNDLVTISSPYSMRMHPVTKKLKKHKGVDIVAKKGASIKATASGLVSEVGYNKSYGNYIIIRHNNDIKTLYAHLSNTLVKKYQSIDCHQIIGTIGSTGVSTGIHLHYEIRISNKPINPKLVWQLLFKN